MNDEISIHDFIIGDKIRTLLERLTASPGTVMEPVFNARSDYGFYYPFMSELIDDYNIQLKVLDYLNERGALRKTKKDNTSYCPVCSSIFISPKMGCTNCNSTDYKSTSLVHHYKCGFVGSEKEFLKTTHFACPKCGDKLRHIGVDYERPTEIFSCNECNEKFSHPAEGFKCLKCNSHFNKTGVKPKALYSYELDTAGALALMRGEEYLSNNNNEYSRIHKYDKMFLDLLTREIKRAQRHEGSLVIVRIVWKNYDLMTSSLDKTEFAYLAENFVSVFKESLREVDVACNYGRNAFIAVLPDTKVDLGLLVQKRISKNILNINSGKRDEQQVKILSDIVSYPESGNSAEVLLEILGIDSI